MNENKLLSENQFSFRYELAALGFSDHLTKQIDRKRTPISIYLDLSNDFYTLDHYILLTKLDVVVVFNSSSYGYREEPQQAMPIICPSMYPAKESLWRGLSIGPGPSWGCTARCM